MKTFLKKRFSLNDLKAYLKFNSDPTIWVVFILLCIISIIEMYSSATSLIAQSVENNQPYNFHILRHLRFLLIGIAFVWVLHYVPFKWVRYGGYFVLAVSIGLLIIILKGASINAVNFIRVVSENEASRWVMILGVKFQPSEIAKLSLIIVVADLISRIREGITKQIWYFWSIMAIVVTVCGLILFENFSTAALLFLVVFLMMFVGQISWKYLVGTVAVLAVVLIVGFMLVKTVPEEKMPNAFHRAYTWVNRAENHINDKDTTYLITDKNRQVMHSKFAIVRGGIIGVLPGNSEQCHYLPGAFSDFIFAIIIEEMGLIGGIFVILLYLVLLYRAGRIATQSKTVFSAVIVIGLTLIIVIQAFIHMAVATNLGPVTGQPLPLISRGGTSTIITCIYIGIILRATRQIRREKQIKMKNEELNFKS